MRFTTLDPLAANYPSLSPYAYCANNPVNYIDPTGAIIKDTDGLFKDFRNEIENSYREVLRNRKFIIETHGEELYNSFVQEYETIQDEYKALEKSDKIYEISKTTNPETEDGKIYNGIYYDDNGVVRIEIYSEEKNVNEALGHELKHGYQFEIGELKLNEMTEDSKSYPPQLEVEAYNRGLFIHKGMGYFLNPEDHETVETILQKDSKYQQFFEK